MTDGPVPAWMGLEGDDRTHDASTPLKFEHSDARQLSGGQKGANLASGRLSLNGLDSEVGEFATDAKVVGKSSNGDRFVKTAGYTLKRDFWLERIAKALRTGHNFRESILFVWETAQGVRQLQLVAVEGTVFQELYDGYCDLQRISAAR